MRVSEIQNAESNKVLGTIAKTTCFGSGRQSLHYSFTFRRSQKTIIKAFTDYSGTPNGLMKML